MLTRTHKMRAENEKSSVKKLCCKTKHKGLPNKEMEMKERDASLYTNKDKTLEETP